MVLVTGFPETFEPDRVLLILIRRVGEIESGPVGRNPAFHTVCWRRNRNLSATAATPSAEP
jgi:hypothetical protein